MNFKQFYKLYLESLSDWSGEWVHYTNIPYLSFNPKAKHSDPTGIYFFPKEFNPPSSFSSKKYKFSAKLKPDAKVLDFSKITREEMTRLADLAGIERFVEIDDLYYSIKNVFNMSKKTNKKPGSFNRFFINAGYDAIFDDIDVVYGKNEKQLIVLNQKCLDDVDMIINTYPIYDEMVFSSEEIIKRLTPYSDSVESSKIKKEKEDEIINDKQKLVPTYALKKYMTFRKGENYVTILAKNNNNSKKTNEISFSIISDNNNTDIDSGASYNYSKRQWNFNSISKIVKDAVSILTGEDDRI
jgi:hypothetical protein